MPLKKLSTVGALLLCFAPGTGEAVGLGGSTMFHITAHNHFSTPTVKATVAIVQEISFGALTAASLDAVPPGIPVPPEPEAAPPRYAISSSAGTRFSLQFYDRMTRRSCSSAKVLLPSEFLSDGETFAGLKVVLTETEGSCVGVVELTWQANDSSDTLIFKRQYARSTGLGVRAGEITPYSTTNDVTISGIMLTRPVSEPCVPFPSWCLGRRWEGLAWHDFITPLVTPLVPRESSSS